MVEHDNCGDKKQPEADMFVHLGVHGLSFDL